MIAVGLPAQAQSASCRICSNLQGDALHCLRLILKLTVAWFQLDSPSDIRNKGSVLPPTQDHSADVNIEPQRQP